MRDHGLVFPRSEYLEQRPRQDARNKTKTSTVTLYKRLQALIMKNNMLGCLALDIDYREVHDLAAHIYKTICVLLRRFGGLCEVEVECGKFAWIQNPK